jgi:hypothetical protein
MGPAGLALRQDGAMGVRSWIAMLVAVMVAAATSAGADPIVSVDADPDAPGIQPVRSVALGSSIRVDVEISGVEEPGGKNLTLELAYAPTVLALDEVTRGDFLSGLGEEWAFYVIPLPSGVRVEWLQRSLDPFGAIGAGDLLSFWFEAVGVGDSVLSVDAIELIPPFWPIVPEIHIGATEDATVTVVPEPGTGLMLGVGCAAIAVARRRATSRA